MVKISRREFVIVATGATAAAVAALPAVSLAAAENDVADRLAAFVGDAPVTEGGITLSMPEIAENGNTVPLSFSVDSPMTADDHVTDVIVLAAGNPNAGVATFHFSPAAGTAEASTRMRLAKTQAVVAAARLSDGTVRRTDVLVKVTIGGCGG